MSWLSFFSVHGVPILVHTLSICKSMNLEFDYKGQTINDLGGGPREENSVLIFFSLNHRWFNFFSHWTGRSIFFLVGMPYFFFKILCDPPDH